MEKWIQTLKAPCLDVIASPDGPHMPINIHKIDGLRYEEFDQIRSVREEYELQHTHESYFSTNC